MRVFCAVCNDTKDGIMLTGRDVMPKVYQVASDIFHKCPDCGNYVGSHKSNKKPLGVIVTKEVRIERKSIHEIMDRMIKSNKCAKAELYDLVTKKIGRAYHTASLYNMDECKIVREALHEINSDFNREKQLHVSDKDYIIAKLDKLGRKHLVKLRSFVEKLLEDNY